MSFTMQELEQKVSSSQRKVMFIRAYVSRRLLVKSSPQIEPEKWLKTRNLTLPDNCKAFTIFSMLKMAIAPMDFWNRTTKSLIVLRYLRLFVCMLFVIWSKQFRIFNFHCLVLFYPLQIIVVSLLFVQWYELKACVHWAGIWKLFRIFWGIIWMIPTCC